MLDITVWDVQHGAATYLRTPNRKNIVVDLGIGAAKTGRDFSPLRHLREAYNVDVLDEVILTHPHRDHLDDIFNFDAFSPKSLRRPEHLTEAEVWAANKQADVDIISKYMEIDRRYSGAVSPENNPERPENNGGVQIRCFIPTQCSRANLNNHSVVTFFTFAGSTILVPGDNEEASWRELLADAQFRQVLCGCDVLVAPHHGRRAGYCADLFKHFRPRLTIVSDGPATETTAVPLYVGQTDGWLVHKRSRGTEERKVVSTRNDGVINVKVGANEDGGRYIQVSID